MSRITLPQAEQNPSSQDDIRRLVEQIRSVRFGPQHSYAGNRTIEPAQLFQPNPQATTLQQPAQPKPTVEVAALSVPAPYQIIADDIMQTIQGLMQHPEDVHNPFEMAEVLFVCGRCKEAAVFYKHTLSTIDPNNPQSAEDRAWLLFQIGNCLRDDDPAAARDSYMKLIAQYPYSPWTEAAKIWGRLISWYQKTNPKRLISESGS
jgi:tetratricopeptide (TPR) repeat protein